MNELPNITCSLILLAIPYFRHVFFFRPSWRIQTKKPEARIQFFDSLRGVAILAVIGIHTVDFYRLELHTETTGLLFTNAFLRFAIPLFVIASGTLLDPHDLQKQKSRWAFYSRKLVRIFIPYVAVTTLWSLGQPGFSVSSLFLHIIRGDILVPYYFVIVLFELYLLYPLIVRFAARRWFLYVSFGISMCVALFRFRYLFKIPLPFEYLFYFAYGIALRPLFLGPQKDKSPTLMPWLGIAACYFAVFFAIPDYYYNAVYFWGLAAFWILYFLRHHLSAALKKSLAYVGRLSLWIFLLHYQILFWVGENHISQLKSLPTGIAVILMIGTTLVLTVLFAALLEVATKVIRRRFRTIPLSH